MTFTQFSAVIITSGLLGLLLKKIKQPPLTGYLVAGILLGGLGIVGDTASLETFGQLGITLLLFLLGLEMNLHDLKALGKISLVAGFFQVLTTFILFFGVLAIFGYPLLASVFISLAFSFSSTIIVVKILSERKDLLSLKGRLSVGILLFQDVVAILALLFVSGGIINSPHIIPLQILLYVVKIVFIFGSVFFLSKKIIPWIFSSLLTESDDQIFIISIVWVLLFSFLAKPLGISLEIGGFLAGLSLSNLPQHLQIASKTNPLKEFFLIPFFFVLGTKVNIAGVGNRELVLAVLALSILIILIKPLLIFFTLSFSGFKKRTSFFSGIYLSQISEFSFILMSLAFSLGYISHDHLTIVTLVGVVTMIVSNYLITYDRRLYRLFQEFPIPSFKGSKENLLSSQALEVKNHIILVGCDRTGGSILSYLKRQNEKVLIVDFNPGVHSRLEVVGEQEVVLGDISDHEVLEALHLDMAKALISTISDIEDNLTLMEYLKSRKLTNLITVFTASSKGDAKRLYQAGAALVTLPEVLAGEYIVHLFDTYGFSRAKFNSLGEMRSKRLFSHP